MQQRRLVQHQLDLGCPDLSLVEVGRDRQAADGRQGQDRGGEAHLESSPPPFLDRMRLRLLRQRVGQDPPLGLFLGPRLRLDPGDLGRPQPLLHPGQVGGESLGDRAGVAGPVLGLAGQAFAGEPGQLRVGPAGVETAKGFGQVPPYGLAVNLAHGPARECRPAGQHLAEDRAQREHVGPLVEPIEIAAGLLRRHVGGSAHDRAHLRELGVRAGPARLDHRLVAAEPGLARRRRPLPAATLWPGPSPSPGPRRSCRP